MIRLHDEEEQRQPDDEADQHLDCFHLINATPVGGVVKLAAHYTHDHAAFGELVLKAAFMRADLQARADRVKALAEETAPYDPKDAPPHFRDSFHAEVVDRGDRLIAHVYNDAPDALYAEFGNGHAGTAHHTLFNALRAAK